MPKNYGFSFKHDFFFLFLLSIQLSTEVFFAFDRWKCIHVLDSNTITHLLKEGSDILKEYSLDIQEDV